MMPLPSARQEFGTKPITAEARATTLGRHSYKARG